MLDPVCAPTGVEVLGQVGKRLLNPQSSTLNSQPIILSTLNLPGP
jgi:hypothetical protein